jgi:DNA-binding NarL/FixJ family response regulator
VVGEASSKAEALHRMPAARPDVAVLDVRLPDGSGVEVCREIRSAFPEIRCLMLTSYADDEALFDAIMAGASGYVLKEIRGTDLVTAIPTGRRRQVTARSGGDPARAGPDPKARSSRMTRLQGLSEQERRILTLIGEEHERDRQIGQAMHLAEKTVYEELRLRACWRSSAWNVGRRLRPSYARLDQPSPPA